MFFSNDLYFQKQYGSFESIKIKHNVDSCAKKSVLWADF